MPGVPSIVPFGQSIARSPDPKAYDNTNYIYIVALQVELIVSGTLNAFYLIAYKLQGTLPIVDKWYIELSAIQWCIGG